MSVEHSSRKSWYLSNMFWVSAQYPLDVFPRLHGWQDDLSLLMPLQQKDVLGRHWVQEKIGK